MHKVEKRASYSCIFLLVLSAFTIAREINYPSKVFSEKAVINVKHAPYSAAGDGVAIDTKAIQNAILDAFQKGKTVYFPNGTYLVDDQIKWLAWNDSFTVKRPRSYLTLIGQSKENSIIKLKDNCQLFQNGDARPFIDMGIDISATADKGRNSAFQNYILNLTIDIGSGNPMAVGVEFRGNNTSGIQDAIIKSSDSQGAGKIGISLQEWTPGPALFKNISIKGFDYGVYCKIKSNNISTNLSFTFENISLESQKIAGFHNDDEVISIRGFSSYGNNRAINNLGQSMLTLIDANINGPSANGFGIESGDQAELFIRNLSSTGYENSVKCKGSLIPRSYLYEFASKSIQSLNVNSRRTLRLPVEETPQIWDGNTANWVEVPPPTSTTDDTDWQNILNAIAQANSTGKSTIWFHPGVYSVGKTIPVAGTVKHFIGFGTIIRVNDESPQFDDPANPKALFKLENSLASDVVFENLTLGYERDIHPGLFFIEHLTSSSLTLLRVMMWGIPKNSYISAAGAGKVYIENVGAHNGAGGWQFGPNQKIWARQFNVEWDIGTCITNTGGKLWILGLKTEGEKTVIETREEGSTELLGGVLKVTNGHAPTVPAFINNESSVSLSYVDSPTSDSVNSQRYPYQVMEINSSHQKFLGNILDRKDASTGALGTCVPLYTGNELKLFSNMQEPAFKNGIGLSFSL